MKGPFRTDDGKWDWREILYRAKGAFAVLLSLAILIGGSYFAYSKAKDAYIAWRTSEDYIGEGTEEIVVTIPKGATLTNIGDILTEKGVVKSTRAFREAAVGKDPSQIQAGRYRLKKQLPAETAFEMLLDRRNRVVVKLTFPEGWRTTLQWNRIVDRTEITKEQLKELAGNRAELEKLGLPKEATGVEGFLFPETYVVEEDIKAADLFKMQFAQFNKVAEDVKWRERSKQLKHSAMETLIIASLVEGEVHKPEYQPLVARVVYNRLSKDMMLQFDSTVHYAVGKTGRTTTTDEERAIDSPYNTYKHKGLPPAPINNPGRTALNAALNPADDPDILYFVTVDLDTGETKFAKTKEEHDANVAEFQAWCQANTGRC